MSATIEFDDFPDIKADITATSVKIVNFLIVGLTGSGKSSIIKSCCSDNHRTIATEMSVQSVTKNINYYEGNQITNPKDAKDKYVVNLFDTVGLGDNDVSIGKILQEIIDCMPKQMTKIHKIVLCFKMDRLRIRMSEELNIIYNFFKMLGAKPENFVICLTFCDTFKNETIRKFWNGLKERTDLEMVKEIETIIYTSFPNLEECDEDENLVKYLKEKMRLSRLRIFTQVIAKDTGWFLPNDNMLRMPDVEFNQLCSILSNYRSQGRSWWGIFKKSDQDELIDCLKNRRMANIANKVVNIH